jgi:hypothetical protein
MKTKPTELVMHDENSAGQGRPIAIFGAAGHTAKFVAEELRRRGHMPILCGRDAVKLQRLASEYRDADTRVASIHNSESLDRAFAGAAAVLNCAGPFADTAAPVIEAALRARIPYLDFAAEPQAVLDAFEQFDAPARQASIVVAPGLAFYGGLGDLLATAALGDWTAADDICIAIALDSWHPTPGTRATGPRSAGRRRFFVDGELALLGDPPPTREWDFPAPFGTQTVVGLPFGEVILLSCHVEVPSIRSYLNLTPLKDIRDPSTPPPRAADHTGRSAQIFAIEAVVRKGGAERRAIAWGRDIYAVTAPILVEAAERILDGRVKAVGTVAPGAIFDAQEFLRALAPQHFSLEIRH